MDKIKLAVLFGGASAEHEVSRMSASFILGNLDAARYEVFRVGITKDGRWLLYEGDNSLIQSGQWETSGQTAPCALSPDRSVRGLYIFRADKTHTQRIDAVFPALHGRCGEDGTIQGLCALAGIPCVGSGVTASAVCMDKDYTHRLLALAGIPGARWICVARREGGNLERVCGRLEKAGIRFPIVVKPANAGSSVGITKVHNPGALHAALLVAFREDGKALLEETLTGAEVECAVMGNAFPDAAAEVGEIEPLREVYDYEGKYCDDTTALHVPARLPKETAEKVRRTALRAYEALGCRGYARVDFFVREDGEVLLNEVNTLPGFTRVSMFPKLFCHDGMTRGALISRLVDYALEWDHADA